MFNIGDFWFFVLALITIFLVALCILFRHAWVDIWNKLEMIQRQVGGAETAVHQMRQDFGKVPNQKEWSLLGPDPHGLHIYTFAWNARIVQADASHYVAEEGGSCTSLADCISNATSLLALQKSEGNIISGFEISIACKGVG